MFAIVISYQNIVRNSIKYVVDAVGIVFSTIFGMKSDTLEFLFNFFFCRFSCIYNKLLLQHSADFIVSVLCKAKKFVGTIWEISVVGCYALKERQKIVV